MEVLVPLVEREADGPYPQHHLDHLELGRFELQPAGIKLVEVVQRLLGRVTAIR